MMPMKKAYVGKWRLMEMEQWEKEYIDLVVPGHDRKGPSGNAKERYCGVPGTRPGRFMA